jgi:hypothetical protein
MVRYLPVALLFASGCARVSSSFTPTNMPPHAMHARPIDSVLLFTSSKPVQPFVEVGIIGSERNQYATDEATILELRKKAAEVGCDGVLLASETTNYVVGASTQDVKRYRAACIVFTGASGAPTTTSTP